MAPAERRRPVGAGAGGDATMLVDRAAEDALVAVFECAGTPFRLVSEEAGERAVARRRALDRAWTRSTGA